MKLHELLTAVANEYNLWDEYDIRLEGEHSDLRIVVGPYSHRDVVTFVINRERNEIILDVIER